MKQKNISIIHHPKWWVLKYVLYWYLLQIEGRADGFVICSVRLYAGEYRI